MELKTFNPWFPDVPFSINSSNKNKPVAVISSVHKKIKNSVKHGSVEWCLVGFIPLASSFPQSLSMVSKTNPFRVWNGFFIPDFDENTKGYVKNYKNNNRRKIHVFMRYKHIYTQTLSFTRRVIMV